MFDEFIAYYSLTKCLLPVDDRSCSSLIVAPHSAHLERFRVHEISRRSFNSLMDMVGFWIYISCSWILYVYLLSLLLDFV